jgi:hypothetical protein
MADEKKKKLELLKQRNEANRQKLNNASISLNTAQTPTANSSILNTSTNSISSNVASSISNIDKLIQETTKAPADINLEEIKKATRRISRYSGDGFQISKMSQSILGISPDTYEDGVQCDLGVPQYESDNEEIEERIPKETTTGYRRSVVSSKQRKTVYNASNKKPQEGITFEDKVVGRLPFDNKDEINVNSGSSKPKTQITEDQRRQILTSQELGDFLSYNSKYVERVSKNLKIKNFE